MEAKKEWGKVKLPMVEIFETVEGEGTMAGFPTTFVRVFNCNLRCVWCDTPYSYAPSRPAFFASIEEIVEQVKKYGHHHVCLTGGEPLIHGEKSLILIQALSSIESVEDIHVETNGAIDLTPFHTWRQQEEKVGKKLRFILDYKLPGSGEQDKMILSNFSLLRDTDEIKFVVTDENDFHVAIEIMKRYVKKGIPLFSPVWESMKPSHLVSLMLKHRINAKLNLQLHKVIWDPDTRGV